MLKGADAQAEAGGETDRRRDVGDDQSRRQAQQPMMGPARGLEPGTGSECWKGVGRHESALAAGAGSVLDRNQGGAPHPVVGEGSSVVGLALRSLTP